AMLPIRGQNNVQGASDVGAIPFVYTDYRAVKDPGIRAEYARAWGVAPESLSLKEGLMVTEIVKQESGVRGMYIMGENPIISDPDIAHAEHWFRELEFLAVQDLFLTETARYADVVLPGSSFAERTGTFVNTERRIHCRPAQIRPPGGEAGLGVSVRHEHRAPALPLTHRHDDAAGHGAGPARAHADHGDPPGRRRGAGPRRRRSRSRDVAAQQSRDLVPYLRAGGARPGLRSLPLPRGRGESPHQPGARSLREDGGAEVLRGADRAGGEPRGGAGGLSV